jgi:hypothetical protein
VKAIGEQYSKIEDLYGKLYEFNKVLETVGEAVKHGETVEDRLDKATELRWIMEGVFKTLSELEAILPR